MRDYILEEGQRWHGGMLTEAGGLQKEMDLPRLQDYRDCLETDGGKRTQVTCGYL